MTMFPNFCKDLLKYSRIQRCACRLLSNSPRKQPAAKTESQARYLLLVCPATFLYLAYWQLKRKIWKEELIAQIEDKYGMEPKELPQDLSNLKELELYPMKVRGYFDYSNEVYIGPRSDTPDRDSSIPHTGFQFPQGKLPGVYVITPFKLADRDLTILVNRGWYDNEKFLSKQTREKGQVHGEQEIVGVLREDQDTRDFFWMLMGDFQKPEKKNGCDIYIVRKINTLARRCGTAPVFMDAKIVRKTFAEPKPIELGVELRNDHTMYAITWATLAVITTALWVSKYRAPARTSSVNAYISQQGPSRSIGKPKT